MPSDEAYAAAAGAPDGAPADRRRDRLVAVAVALLAAAGFALFILRLPPEVGQFSKYPNAALQYLHGMAEPERLLDFSPLYLGLHVAAFRFLAHPLDWIPRFQIGLLALAAALLFLLLRQHFTLALSLTGTAAFLLGKSVAIYGHIFEPEPLMILFLVATVLCASRNTLAGAAAAGACLALGVLTRPSVLPLALLVPVHFLLGFDDRKRFLKATALFLLPLALGAVVLASGNERLPGFRSLLIMDPGAVFFVGNNPLSSGRGAAYPPVVNEVADSYPGESDFQHTVFRFFARRMAGADLTPAAANRFWAAKAENYIRDFPGLFLNLSARRVLYLFHGYRWDDIRAAWAAGRNLDGLLIPFVPFALVSALALAGLVSGLGSWRTYFLPYAVFLNLTVLMVFTYPTDRQRVLLYPFFVFFAVAALARARAATPKQRTAALAAVLPLLALFTIESGRMRDNRHIWEGFSRLGPLLSEALRHRDESDFPAAREKAAAALAVGPWRAGSLKPARLPATEKELAALAARELSSRRTDDPSTRLDRALLLIEAGRLDEAAALLEALEREGAAFEILNGRPHLPAFSLGRIAARRGEPDEAIRLLKRALAQAPGDPQILAHLTCLTGDDAYAKRIFRYFGDPDALFALGQACLENGRIVSAVTCLERLTALIPEYQPGQIALAAALGAAGQDSRAAGIYLAATEQPPELVRLEEWIVPIFARLARNGSAEDARRYDSVLRQYGR